MASFEPAERAAVTLAGDRFAATFAEPPGGELEITSHRTVPRADDGTIAVHSLLRPVRRCPAKTVATRIERPGRARRAPVARDGSFKLGHRMVCPAELGSCRVFVQVRETVRKSSPGAISARGTTR